MTEQPMEQRTNPPTRFVRLPEVVFRTGLSRSTLKVRMREGCFPRPVALGARAVGWIEAEVDEWIRERIAESRGERQRRRPTDPKGKEETMRTLSRTVRAAVWAALWMLMPSVLWAQGTSPWVEAVNELQAQFTGPIARGLSLIAIVVGGLMFAFGEGGSKRTLAGIIFGLGMAMGAVNFLAWLF